MPRTIGVPKVVKDNERRVSMQPDGATELVHHSHEVDVRPGPAWGLIRRRGVLRARGPCSGAFRAPSRRG